MGKAGERLEKVREIIGAWPETSEKISHGAPTFWGGRKTFAMFVDNHHGDGRVAVWIKSDVDGQEHFVAMDSETFFVPPYVGPRGWVGMRLDRDPDWEMAASLLEDGYRSVAPKRALAKLDES